MKQRVVLYFGSFNPVHRGHIALAEYVVAEGIADRVVLIVSPQNPHKEQSGLAAEFSRYEMCQAACAASRFPELIQVSAV
ncbi:MAG: adenylyltransferase/cytidyltransferase family protein, partial [Alistipes sp.]|nr:adenylyltransferase/cytidyltransferase family protein [Alistipes sp.]